MCVCVSPYVCVYIYIYIYVLFDLLGAYSYMHLRFLYVFCIFDTYVHVQGEGG